MTTYTYRQWRRHANMTAPSMRRCLLLLLLVLVMHYYHAAGFVVVQQQDEQIRSSLSTMANKKFGYSRDAACTGLPTTTTRIRRQPTTTTTTTMMMMRMASRKNNNNNDNTGITTTTNPILGGITNGLFRRAVLATAAAPFIEHDAELPAPAKQLISPRAKIVLNFIVEYLDYLKSTKLWDVDVYANGGYVRDLLLGRVSPDLDLSFGLTKCPKSVTVADIFEETLVDHFCQVNPQLAISSVTVPNAGQSVAAEKKEVDAVQLQLTIVADDENNNDNNINNNNNDNANAVVVELDLLPTIGSEVYDEGDRIPKRDGRGTAEQDSLRRDLTVGSMLLHVTSKQKSRSSQRTNKNKNSNRGNDDDNDNDDKNDDKSSQGGGLWTTTTKALLSAMLEKRRPSNDNSNDNNGKQQQQAQDATTKTSIFGGNALSGGIGVAEAAARAASDRLQYVLLDYHGGIEDIFTRTLSCPVPQNATLRDVWDELILTKDDEDLARSLGLGPSDDEDNDSDKSGDNLNSAPYYFSTPQWDDATKIRALRWSKLLRDDPYRLLRTLRFSATLGFRIDRTFWLAAVPFALRQGNFDAKVSHTRKVYELRKAVGGAGIPGLVQFWCNILNPPLVGCGYALRDAFFSTSLPIGAMDCNRAQVLAAQLPRGLSVDEKVGASLAVAFLSCTMDENNGINNGTPTSSGGDNSSDGNGSGNDDPFAVARRLERIQQITKKACKGLRVPTTISRAAIDAIQSARRLLEPVPVLGMHTLFARAVNWPTPAIPVSIEDRARQFALMVRIWNLPRRKNSPEPRLVMALLAAAASANDGRTTNEMAREIQANFRLLPSSEHGVASPVVGPQPQEGALLGAAVTGLPEVPPHLRGQMIAAVNVLARLRGDAPTIRTPDQLRNYLEIDCDGLLTKLTNEWWDCNVERGKADGHGDNPNDDDNKEVPSWVGSALRPPYCK